MIGELDLVALTRDIKQYGLQKGDIGVIVHCYTGKITFEVEFVAGDGETIALLTLSKKDVRRIEPQEILHVREVTPLWRSWRKLGQK